MEQIFFKKFFSRTGTLKGKTDVQLTFDDSYNCFVSKFDVFKNGFVLVFTNGTTFNKQIFLCDLYIKRQ